MAFRTKENLILRLSRLGVFIFISAFLGSCHQVSQPPLPVIIVNTYYKTPAGADLLNPGTPGSFKAADISVRHEVEIKGVIQKVTYNQTGIYVDASGLSYIELSVPSNFGKTPLASYVTLSSSLTDTVTYYFAASPRFPNIPDKVYYNKQLVWDVINVKGGEGAWPPITIIK